MGREESSICKTNRLVIHVETLDNDLYYNIGEAKNKRSLLFLNKGSRIMKRYNCIKFGIFKYLKILVLECYTFENGKLPEGIEKLKLLKLLSLKKSYVIELPPSICKLPCLQTLNLKVDFAVHSPPLRLPNSIYKMRRLRHLFLNSHRSIIGGGKLKLEGLNELEMITGVSSWGDDITHLGNLPNLQVLEVRILGEQNLSMMVDHMLNHQERFRSIKLWIDMDVNMNSEDGSTLLGRLVMCRSLHFLHTRFWRISKLPAYEVRLYQNVIDLDLSLSMTEEDPMEILEKLPMLRSLRLNHAYMGRKMVCGATGFLNSENLIWKTCLIWWSGEWRKEQCPISLL
ncbi:UNVERIFIED_CONTAM: hypothetical protein Sangu_2925700 [Sesamum angustifolium]|uniref:Disease resistance R13L4/SHOC-2-like LRR domain-containing protein n=1 Tax=Sesamum angustifolium TaxID=2727405 RepID=A0AAW2IKY2_9LAMI